MSKVQFTIDEGQEEFFDIEESLSDLVGEIVPLEEFKFNKRKDVFLEITNMMSYRPGHVDRWVEVDGKVWLIDDLNENEAIEYEITKEELLEKFKKFM